MRLIRHAWRAADPCTIADNEDAFDRVLGSRWKKLVPIIRQHFTPAVDRPGRLRCDWLLAVYERQLAKHQSYQTRGGKGGRPKRSSGESSASNNQSSGSSSADSSAKSPASRKRRKSKAEPEALSRESTTEVKSCESLQTHTAFNPPSDALALGAARAAGAESNEPRAPAPGEVAAAEAYVADHPEIAAEIDAAIAAGPADLPAIAPGVYHDRRLQQVNARFMRTGLVLAAYRSRTAQAAP